MATAQQFDQAERSHEAAWLAREEDGDDTLTEDGAMQLAADELERDPYAIAYWLSNTAVSEHIGPVRVLGMDGVAQSLRDGEEVSPAELLAALWSGTNETALMALEQLRDLYLQATDTRDLVRERAAELLAEGEQDEDAYYDWLDSQREAA